MKMKYSLIGVLIFGAFIIGLGCAKAQPKYHAGGPYYYKSWASYVLPYRPTGEISYQEAKQLESSGKSYYEAYFYEDGYIKEIKKYYHGQLEFRVTYSYEKGILARSEWVDRAG